LKTIVIACGIGIATSTVLATKVKELLEAYRVKAEIIQCALADIARHVEQADLIITTIPIKDHYPKPIIYGMPLLTGMDVKTTEQKILKHLEKNRNSGRDE